MIRSVGLALLCWSSLSLAQPAAAPAGPADAMGLLRHIYQATETLSYTGTFVYQQGDRTETSRITRLAGPGGGIERVEVLDGTPREVVRTRDTVRCYIPETRTIKVERRLDQRAFPALLPERLSELARHYTITRGEPQRIAGYDCDSVVLSPRDDLRYGYRLWADVRSGMLLKARTFNKRGELVEQFTFAQFSPGNVSRGQVRTRHATQNWHVMDASVAPANLARTGWVLGSELPGFRKVTEVTRKLRESRPVGQIVYSDGMAAVSVFIEPLAGRTEIVRPGPSSLGAFQIYTRELANHVVTVVGEAPAASVRLIAQQVEYRRPPP